MYFIQCLDSFQHTDPLPPNETTCAQEEYVYVYGSPLEVCAIIPRGSITLGGGNIVVDGSFILENGTVFPAA